MFAFEYSHANTWERLSQCWVLTGYLCGDYTQFNLKHIEIIVKGQKNYWPITGFISAQLNY